MQRTSGENQQQIVLSIWHCFDSPRTRVSDLRVHLTWKVFYNYVGRLSPVRQSHVRGVYFLMCLWPIIFSSVFKWFNAERNVNVCCRKVCADVGRCRRHPNTFCNHKAMVVKLNDCVTEINQNEINSIQTFLIAPKNEMYLKTEIKKLKFSKKMFHL